MLSRAHGSLPFCLLLVIGCAPIVERRGSPLDKPCMSADSVVLEIYSARFAFNDPNYNETLWQQADEQPFPPDLRRVSSIAGRWSSSAWLTKIAVIDRGHAYHLAQGSPHSAPDV